MATILTKEQQMAVDNRGGDILVSAAAGSGKTKVLVERILKQICEEGLNVNDFVIITYTSKAADELRVKIRAALAEKIAAEPDNKHLREQLQRLYSANISTVHSYCSHILRENAAVIGLPADFKVIDEREARVIRAMCMDEVLENAYRTVKEGKDRELKAMIEELAYGRDGDRAIPAMVFSALETIQAHPWPKQWVKESIASLSTDGYTDLSQTTWGSYLMRDIQGFARSQFARIDAAIAALDNDAILSEAYMDTLTDDKAKLKNIATAMSWDELADMASRPWARLKTLRKKKDGSTDYDLDLQETVKDMRDRYKKAVDAKTKPLQSGTSAGLLADIELTSDSIKGLFKMVERFTKEYSDRKKAHNMLDFSDLEHKTIEMLIDEKTGEYTDIAKQLQNRYKGVCIDEYQDTNEVQEAIFNAISNENRFMVGDVKQSIYQFRLADPSIFLRHYNLFVDANSARKGEPRKIVLSKNFRSRVEVLDATNEIMRSCMSPLVGGVEYTDTEALIAGRDYPDVSSDTAVELNVIDMANPAAVDTDDEDAAGKLKADVESKFVANRVQELLSREGELIIDEETGEPRRVQASDIAILLRSAKNSARYYEKALAELGIESITPKSESLMETTEVATLYNFLQILDNPQQDVPLVSVLASPLFGFTAEDLGKVRIADKKSKSYYAALRTAAEGMAKAQEALNVIDSLRHDALRMELPRLFQEVLDRTDAMDVFGSMSNGVQRMDNINAFTAMIADYDANHTGGLFRFIAYIEELREQGDTLEKPNNSRRDNAVTISSIHSAKGLEYPIVILADMSRKFNAADLKKTLLMHKDLGLGVQVTDTKRKVRYPTVARTAIAVKLQEEMKSEELRILYVALTRAQQKLILCHTERNLQKTLQRLEAYASYPLTAAASQSAATPGEWVLLTALTRNEADALHAYCDVRPETHATVYPWSIRVLKADQIGGKHRTLEELESVGEAMEEDVLPIAPFDELDIPDLAERLMFRYPHLENIGVQTKVVATQLAQGDMGDTDMEISCRRPDFEKQATKATAAERGTATHAFLQYADYAKLYSDGSLGVEEELARLKNRGFIDANTADAVMADAVENLFSGEVGKELASIEANSIEYKREFPFSVLIPASELNSRADANDSRAQVVLQGVIDLFYVDKEKGIHIIDYKSDYVKTDADEEAKLSAYKAQIDIYAKALQEIYGKDTHIAEKSIIFVRTGHKRTVCAA